MAIQTQAKIPVFDFSNLDFKPGTSSWFSACKDVCSALEKNGFVVELGSNTLSELHNTMFSSVRELFEFPTETKMKVTYDRPFRGYSSFPPFKSTMIDNATSTDLTQKLTNIFWPNWNDPYREGANSYVKLMAELNKMVTRMIFENYGVKKYYDSHMESTAHSLVLLKYTEPKKTGTNQGIPSHTDKHFTIIVHQNRAKGLEIKTKDGEWIGFDYSPSSFLFLACDALQVWSNDKIKACIHRVMLNENPETRCSFGLVSYNNKTICVPEKFVDEQHPLQYKPLNLNDYARAHMASIAQRKEVPIAAYCGV